MKTSEGLTRVLQTRGFRKTIDLYDKDIILNSIRVYEVEEDGCVKRKVPYTIQCAGEKYVTITPDSTWERFIIEYKKLVYTRTITICREDYPSTYKGDFVISLDNDFNIL